MRYQLANGSWIDTDDPGEPGYATRAPRQSVTLDEAAILTALASGKYCLEIGTGLAVSTRALAAKAEHVMTVDPDPWVQQTIWPALSGLSNVSVWTELPRSLHRADLAFIDGNHVAGSVRADLARVFPLMDKDGLIVLHDIKSPVVYAVAREIGSVFVLDTEHGLGLLFVASILREKR